MKSRLDVWRTRLQLIAGVGGLVVGLFAAGINWQAHNYGWMAFDLALAVIGVGWLLTLK